MISFIERKALVWAVLSSILSMTLTSLAAVPIKTWSQNKNAREETSVPAASSPEMIAAGKSLFAMSCAQCHASDATGDEGPDLHNLSLSNARITKTIQSGIKGEMPSFAKKYNEQQVASIVVYLRTLK